MSIFLDMRTEDCLRRRGIAIIREWINKRFICLELLNQCSGNAETLVREIIGLERKPLTLNNTHYSYFKELWRLSLIKWDSDELKQLRARASNGRDANGPFQQYHSVASETNTALVLRQKSNANVPAQRGQQVIPSDSEFGQELDIMADILAYFEISVIRTIDHVIMTIEEKVVGKIAVEIENNLTTGLRLEGKDGNHFARKWGTDSAETMAHHKELFETRDKLGSVLNELESLRIGAWNVV
jgi:hypothetical protein